MININEEELQCKICYEFLHEAVICDKCSHAFCQECAINYKNKAKKYGRVDKCPICGSLNFTFERCEEIDKLIKKIKQKPLQCQHCKRIIFEKEKYEEHIQECKYQCKFCFMLFDKEDDLLRHIKKNTEELFKALDLMNASRNKVKYNKEEKPKKKKIIKKKTKNINNNIDYNELKEEKKIENVKKKQKKENLQNIDEKIDAKKAEIKKVEEKKVEEKKMDAKVEEKKVDDVKKVDEKVDIIGNNSEFSKKIVKKKIIKKKIKILKKKDGTNSNTINYFDKNISEENLLKNKINKTNNEVEDKLVTDINNLNIGTEKKTIKKKIKIKRETNKNFQTLKTENSEKINSNILNNTLKTLSSDKLNQKEKNTEINKNKPREELEKKEDINSNENKEKKEETKLQIKNKKTQKEIIYPNTEKKYLNRQIVEEEEKICKYIDNLNNPKPESNRPATIPGDAKLNEEYDLYFCGKPNHIDCICCTEHKCKPGSCMCISCMKLNKKYHKLKSHYLINKSGRACKYSHGYFHCYCNYIHIVYDVGNNIFKPVYKCQGDNICKPCEEITLLMETYLPNTICQKLRDRETQQAQF